jgi:hypothetical protein
MTAFSISNRMPASPDESQALFFSQNLNNTGSLVYKNPLNLKFNQKIFGSRQYVQNGDNTVPSAFLGYIVMLWLFRFTGSAIILSTAGPLLAVLCLYYVYRLSKLIFSSNKIAYLSVILVGFFPPFIYWTVSYYNDITELAFLIAGFYYLLLLTKVPETKNYILATAMFCLVIWQRYTDILLLGISLTGYLWFVRKKLVRKKLVLSLLVAFVLLLPIAILNHQLYGSIAIFGESDKQQLAYPYISPGVPNARVPLLPFRSLNILLHEFIEYFIIFLPIITSFSLLGLTMRFKRHLADHTEYLFGFIFVCWCLYYLGGYFFGYDLYPGLSSSYTRYLLPVYTIMLIYGASFIAEFNKRILSLTIVVILVLFTTQTFFSQAGLPAVEGQLRSAGQWHSALLKAVPPNGVVFVKGNDKYVFPARQAALYQVFSNNHKPGVGVNKTLSLMRSLLQKNYPVYLLQEDQYPVGLSSTTYINQMYKYDLRVTNYNSSLQLYKISLGD